MQDLQHFRDDDPNAPWMQDTQLGGMSPPARRNSWNASQLRLATTNGHDVYEPPPPNGPEDYDLPAHGAEPDLIEEAGDFQFETPANWPDGPPAPVSWVARNRIPCGDVATLDGDGGSGKTMAGLQLACAAQRGATDWFGSEVTQGTVVFLSAEEPRDEIRRRIDRIADRQGFALDQIRDLRFWFPDDVGNCTFATAGPAGIMQPTPLFRQIEGRVAAIRPTLVVLDNVAAVYGGNQNDRVSVRSFMNLWRGLARRSGAAVLLLNHPSLSGLTTGTGRGGNMDWRNSVRAALHLKPADNKADAERGVRVLECVKNNYAPLGEPARLEWIGGVLTPEGSIAPHERAAGHQKADLKFLELLSIRNTQGRDVSDKPGRNYAPAAMAEMDEAGGFTNRALARAMERLFTAQAIALEQVGPPSANKKRIVRAF